MKLPALVSLLLACAPVPAQMQNGAPSAAPAARSGRGARVQPGPIDFDDHPGWAQLFDGKTLSGRDGDAEVWKVQDGAIVGEFDSPEATRNGQTFLIWQGGQPADFELKAEIKLEGLTADSGIQYRGYLSSPSQPNANIAVTAAPPRNAKWNLAGYQFDFNFPGNYNGQVAEAGTGARGIIAYRGQVVRAEEGKRMVSALGTTEALSGLFKTGDWNQAHLIARGNTLTQMINGRVTAILIDEDPTKFKSKGFIGPQRAGSGTVKIRFAISG